MSETATVVSEAEMAGADIKVNEMEQNPESEFGSLFDEDVSDAELQGESKETTEEKETAASESKGEDGKTESDKAQTAEEKEAKEAEAKKEVEAKKVDETEAEKAKTDEKTDEVDYSKPPPTGYVAIPALKESRRETEAVKGQLEIANQNIQALQAQVAAPKVEAETDDEFKDFKVLSDNELKELTEDDVEEAVLYMNKLSRFKEVQSSRKQREQIEQYEQQQVEAVIGKSVERISSEVPGIYEEGNTIGNELFEFAVENGFNNEFLTLLTSPGTRITPVDKDGNISDKSYPLADGAASLVTMLYKLRESSKMNDSENLRSEIEAEVRKDEREKVTRELMDKFKNETTGQTFKSIADSPGGSNDEPGGKQFYTEKDFSNMSDEEERKVLGG